MTEELVLFYQNLKYKGFVDIFRNDEEVQVIKDGVRVCIHITGMHHGSYYIYVDILCKDISFALKSCKYSAITENLKVFLLIKRFTKLRKIFKFINKYLLWS